MYCSRCGTHNQDGAHFCQNCGAPLQEPGAGMQLPPASRYQHSELPSPEEMDYQEQPIQRGRSSRPPRAPKPQDPYSDQISQLKLELKQLKLYLRQITTQMSATRARYNQTSAFVPEGLIHRGYKWFEDMNLMGPQQQKQHLQQQILQLEQQLLGLQQAQAQWKLNNR